MAISDDDIVRELTMPGVRVEDFFIIGHEICALDSRGMIGSIVIEDVEGEEEGEMHFAILAFLRRRGAPVYESQEDYDSRKNKRDSS